MERRDKHVYRRRKEAKREIFLPPARAKLLAVTVFTLVNKNASGFFVQELLLLFVVGSP